MRITFVSRKGKRAVWDLPVSDASDEDAVIRWVKINKDDAAAAIGFVDIILAAARSKL